MPNFLISYHLSSSLISLSSSLNISQYYCHHNYQFIISRYSTLEEDIQEESEQVNIRITEYSEEVTDPKILEPSSPIKKSSLQVPQSTIEDLEEEDRDENQGEVVPRRHNEKDRSVKKLTRKIRSKSLVETAV